MTEKSDRKTLEESYQMGYIDTPKYNMLSKAFNTEGCTVKYTHIEGKDKHFCTWTITIDFTVDK